MYTHFSLFSKYYNNCPYNIYIMVSVLRKLGWLKACKPVPFYIKGLSLLGFWYLYLEECLYSCTHVHAYNSLNGFLSPLHEKHHSKKCTSKHSALLKIQYRGGVTEESDFGLWGACCVWPMCTVLWRVMLITTVSCQRKRSVGLNSCFLSCGTPCSCASGSLPANFSHLPFGLASVFVKCGWWFLGWVNRYTRIL